MNSIEYFAIQIISLHPDLQRLYTDNVLFKSWMYYSDLDCSWLLLSHVIYSKW